MQLNIKPKLRYTYKKDYIFCIENTYILIEQTVKSDEMIQI